MLKKPSDGVGRGVQASEEETLEQRSSVATLLGTAAGFSVSPLWFTRCWIGDISPFVSPETINVRIRKALGHEVNNSSHQFGSAVLPWDVCYRESDRIRAGWRSKEVQGAMSG
jgi:hypothetical protein